MAAAPTNHNNPYNADKPSSRNIAARLLMMPKSRSMMTRNHYSSTALLCSTTTAMALLFSIRGGTSSATSSSSVNNNNSNNVNHQYRLLHTTIVHRHGDRTPITPLRDEDYWKTTLPTTETLQEIANGTMIQRKESSSTTSNNGKNKSKSSKKKHTAMGRGPFGKLTQLGLTQMMDIGRQLKKDESLMDIAPHEIRVLSTDFPRTIQSVQALLQGLFPNYNNSGDKMINIDGRHTHMMIPDPQPRNSQEQVALEQSLIRRPLLVKKEQEMRPLAVKCTKALLPLLAKDAFDIHMGIDDASSSGNGKENHEEPVLPWAQLAEITKCLQVRNKLPQEISLQEQQALSDHLAWRWFQSLRDPRLANLAMGPFAREIIGGMQQQQQQQQEQEQNTNHKLTIYSCHDSSLIGLICAFGLDNPSQWPEYGSYLKIDLLETKSHTKKKQKVVQFSLNGERLRWLHHKNKNEDGDGQEEDGEIPLKLLQQHIESAGSGQ